MVPAEQTLRKILDAFDFGTPAEEAARYGQGHINDTFPVCTGPKNARRIVARYWT